MKNILPEWLYKSIEQNYKLDDVYELRIRQNKPIQICYKGKYLEIKKSDGLYQHPIIASKEIIEFIISLATKNSLYAYEDQIKNGYIVTDNGIRIGLCGTVVTRNEQVTFIKNITSLNLRIAHRIQGCSRKIINYIISNSTVKNTLIISEPGAGKTTLLRDMVEVLSKQFNIPNILVIDERFELAGENNNFDIDFSASEESGTEDSADDTITILIQTENYGNIKVLLVLEATNKVNTIVNCSKIFPKELLLMKLKDISKEYKLESSVAVNEQETVENSPVDKAQKVHMSGASVLNPYVLLMAHAVIRTVIEIDKNQSLVKTRKQKSSEVK